jgi:hypothetical protein
MNRGSRVFACVAVAMVVTILGGCSSSTTSSSSTTTPKLRRGTVFAVVCQADPSCRAGLSPLANVKFGTGLVRENSVILPLSYKCPSGDIIKVQLFQGSDTEKSGNGASDRIIKGDIYAGKAITSAVGAELTTCDSAYHVANPGNGGLGLDGNPNAADCGGCQGHFGPGGGIAEVEIDDGSKIIAQIQADVDLVCMPGYACPPKILPGSPAR